MRIFSSTSGWKLLKWGGRGENFPLGTKHFRRLTRDYATPGITNLTWRDCSPLGRLGDAKRNDTVAVVHTHRTPRVTVQMLTLIGGSVASGVKLQTGSFVTLTGLCLPTGEQKNSSYWIDVRKKQPRVDTTNIDNDNYMTMHVMA